MTILALVEQAWRAGARLKRACEVVGVTSRTLQRWKTHPNGQDRRKGPHKRPEHALSDIEKEQIVTHANSPEYRNLSPEQVVAKLADSDIYVCSERWLRRVLAQRQLAARRDRAKPATTQHKPREHAANGSMQVLAWDITYLRNARIKGS